MVETKVVKVKVKKPRKKAEPKLLGRGQPTKLTPELQARMVELMRLGMYAEDSAAEMDISGSTFFNWMDRGRKERERLKMVPDAKPRVKETIYLHFLEAIETARGKGTVLHHSNIVKAAVAGDWRASAYILERTRPEKYGNKEKIEHSGSLETKMTVEMGDLEDKVSQILALRKSKEKKDVKVSAK